MKQLLFDSNALVFYVTQDSRFGQKTIRLMDQAELYFSPLSLVELGLKSRRDKSSRLTISPDYLEKLGFDALTLEPDIADFLPNLETSDPFDIMLVAQALSSNMQFLTADARILQSGLDQVLDLTD